MSFTQAEIVDFLLSFNPFNKIALPVLEEFVSLLEVVHVQGGSTIAHQGAFVDCMYVVIHGRLKRYRHEKETEIVFINEMGPGELVGEAALIGQVKRTSTIRAIRDSVLLKITQEVFYSFVLKHPDILLHFTRICIDRLLHTKPAQKERTALRTIMLAPAANNPLFECFVVQFMKELSATAEILHLNSSSFDSNVKSIAWLNEQEFKYQYVVYEADKKLTPWTRLCLRQADHVFFVGLANQDPGLNPVETFFFETKSESASTSELVLLHANPSVAPLNTQIWTHLRHNSPHQHVCLSNQKDFSKLIRFIAGKSIGLVLSGGGARGLAHVGVIKALEELKIPIDYVAGSSMGAVIAGAYAFGMDYQTILHQVEKILLPSMENSDYTLPLLSLKSGKTISLALQEAFGKDFQLKDCWTNFFCVSTNLSQSCVKVHNQGVLWESIRASISIPVIFPPIIDTKGSVLVDGGILNNMPVDIMKNFINEGNIISVSTSSKKKNIQYSPLDPWVSGWQLLANQLTPWREEERVPKIGEMVMEMILLSGDQHQMRMEEESDLCIALNLSEFGLLDFKSFRKIIDMGYQAAIKQLSFLSFQ